MGVGPNLLLDKSSFEMLSLREHALLERLFMVGMQPILVMEIVADLAKASTRKRERGRPPAARVRSLAQKFNGSGGMVVLECRRGCLGNLLGNRVPMTGQFVVGHATTYPLEAGGYGATIDLHPLNRAVMRWREGLFSEVEHQHARHWRSTTRGFDHVSFRRRLYQEKVLLPRVSTSEDVARHSLELLRNPHLQGVWLQWLLDQLAVNRTVREVVTTRWETSGSPPLESFAPYAAHCSRCMLALEISLRSCFVGWKPSNVADLIHLFYLPFCMVFTSNDKLHTRLAPSLMRRNQTFISGEYLKAELSALLEHGAPGYGSREDPNEDFTKAAPRIAAMFFGHMGGGPLAPCSEDSLV